KEDEPVDSFFIIKRGQVRVIQRDVAGKDHTVALLHQGDFFGEIAPVTGRSKASNFTVVTTSHCEILTMSLHALDDLITRHPGVKNSLRRHYMNRLSMAKSGAKSDRPKVKTQTSGM